MLIESELQSEARLAAMRPENESESLRGARLAADVEREIVAPMRIKMNYCIISDTSG